MLSHFRNEALLRTPELLESMNEVDFVPHQSVKTDPTIQEKFPHIFHQDILRLTKKNSSSRGKLKVGCVLSGGPAPGGHNVIYGVFEALKEMNRENQIIGFIDGLDGFLKGHFIELNHLILEKQKNLGGFYLLGSSRKKIQDEEDFRLAKNQALQLHLDALVVIGGDDSNTNGAILADYFAKEKIPCQVIGIPKTIDGDLRHEFVEVSFGFDTASKIYSEEIGNILNDAKSAKKYYHFIKLMGRSASHLTLECALNTHPNYTFISEEMKKRPIREMIHEIVEMIVFRSRKGMQYGCILIPEGLLEFIPEFNELIKEINSNKIETKEQALDRLKGDSALFFKELPPIVQSQIFLERDPHGNIPLSQIQTELVVIEWVRKKLSEKKEFQGKFTPTAHFIGYEGRSGFPTQFDCEYTYALGRLAAKMISSGLSGYMAGLTGLKQDVSKWVPFAIPLCSLMHMKEVKGEAKAVIEKSYVDFHSASYRSFLHRRERLMVEDDYRCLGPIQFFGPDELVNQRPKILD
jgi:pyrophosphate--fructose-6-phosphate 1-phosphotransferase